MPSVSVVGENRKLTCNLYRELKFFFDTNTNLAQEGFRTMELENSSEGTLNEHEGVWYIEQEWDQARDRMRGMSTSLTLRPGFIPISLGVHQTKTRFRPAGSSKDYRVFVTWKLEMNTPILETLTIDRDGPNHCTIAPADAQRVPVELGPNQDKFCVPAINNLPWTFHQLVYFKGSAAEFGVPRWFRDGHPAVVACIDEIFERGDADDVGDIAEICVALRGAAAEKDVRPALWREFHLAVLHYVECINCNSEYGPAAVLELLSLSQNSEVVLA